ncbi:vacuolar DHA amino acid exporter [Dendrothele bispora CBS 962.96]|uniref:Vacuolar DHA amino acid exporter n=1 Tax=Dendrothele bispora (strain CBS 962.96) TaxID=1314807 RepID=A0A4S8MKY9_DENBC|nr:vacuolar DHA amino acid exporter [Dendrothele bispora CBS 962.96]
MAATTPVNDPTKLSNQDSQIAQVGLAAAPIANVNDHDVGNDDEGKGLSNYVDIEHMPVENDPRKWSDIRKNIVLLQISFGAMVAGFAGNIQMPAVGEMQQDLHTTSSQISLSLSLFILVQGGMPLLWSTISEVKGRKIVYLSSLLISTIGAVVTAIANSIELVIAFRVVQAAGSSAVMSIGAATLADIYDPHERGAKMGIFYLAPLLGPSLGAIFGGVLTSAFTWRGPFYFLTILSGVVFLSFVVFFKDTFRKERSWAYRNDGEGKPSAATSATPTLSEEPISAKSEKKQGSRDLEKGIPPKNDVGSQVFSDVKISLTDVNPLQPLKMVISRRYNFVMLIASGMLFAFAFMIVYTTSRTLERFYGYNPLKIGLVLLAYGIGGRWSDLMLTRLKSQNHGISYPEMRLKSTIHGILVFPPCVVGFGWVCQEHLHVAVICVFLFLCGFFSIAVYTSTLAYLVDANVGRSSTAIALNSAFRGTFAFVALEVAVPLQDGLGDGWTYTIVAAFMAFSGFLTILTMYKGQQWRGAEVKEKEGKEEEIEKEKENS